MLHCTWPEGDVLGLQGKLVPVIVFYCIWHEGDVDGLQVKSFVSVDHAPLNMARRLCAWFTG